MLPVGLPSLLTQDYPGRAEVFLVDDGSTDSTGDLARELSRRHGGLPLTVGSPGEPPAGWTGKLWAVRQLRRAAPWRAPVCWILWALTCPPPSRVGFRVSPRVRVIPTRTT
ncbi:hypothetical protein SCANM63S_04471 [Streptomyces canarius]